MTLLLRMSAIALMLSLGGCMGGLLGGGKAPTTLVTLTPAAADPGQITRTAGAGQSVTIATPTTSRELSTVRVPVQLTPSDVQYVTNLQLADTPGKLFAGLLAETVRRTTNARGNVATETTREQEDRLRLILKLQGTGIPDQVVLFSHRGPVEIAQTTVW